MLAVGIGFIVVLLLGVLFRVGLTCGAVYVLEAVTNLPSGVDTILWIAAILYSAYIILVTLFTLGVALYAASQGQSVRKVRGRRFPG